MPDKVSNLMYDSMTLR